MADVDYKPAPLVPVTDPIELRDRTVRDYKRNVERMGGSASTADIEKLAIADLHMVDVYKAGLDLSPKPAAKPAPKPRAPVIVDPRSSSPVLRKGKQKTDRPEVQYARAWKRGEKWAHAMGRIERILEGATPHSDIKVMAATCNDPVRALEYLRLFAAWLTRHRASKHNPFISSPGHVLSENDAARKFESEVYNLCDRSSAKLGPWWVPR